MDVLEDERAASFVPNCPFSPGPERVIFFSRGATNEYYFYAIPEAVVHI
jgi:hypothetical protein